MIKANITSGETNMKRLTYALIIVLLSVSYAPARAQDDPAVIGWLYIPALDMAEPLYQAGAVNDVYQIPEHDAAHLDGTAWIDTMYSDLDTVTHVSGDWPAGLIGLAGHRSDVFSALVDKNGNPTLQAGDVIKLAEWPLLVTFEVISTEFVYYDPDLLISTPEEQHLMLITCDGDRRLVIEAVRSG